MSNKQEEIIKEELVFETYTIREFLGEYVRIVDNEYIVLKDMFDVLGRLDKEGSWKHEMKVLKSFLEGMGLLCDLVDINIKDLDFEEYRTEINQITIDDIEKELNNVNFGGSYNTLPKYLEIIENFKKREIKMTSKLKCLKLDSAYISLTQFKPRIKKDNEEKSKQILIKWFNFMKFIHELILENKNEIDDIVLTDEDYQKANISISMKMGLNPATVNDYINYLMAKILRKNKLFDGDYIDKENLRKLSEIYKKDFLYIRRKMFEKFNQTIKYCIKNNESINVADSFVYEYGKRLYKNEYGITIAEGIKSVKEKLSDRTILHLRKKKTSYCVKRIEKIEK